MEKFLNFCKKPLCIISAIIMVVFTALLIFISCQSHGKKYVYSLNILGYKLEVVMEMDDDDITSVSYINGQIQDAPISVPYKIIDGVLYTYPPEMSTPNRVGKINAYEIVMENLNTDDGTISRGNVVLSCTLNNALKIVSIVMLIVGAIGVFVSISVIKKVQPEAQQENLNQPAYPTKPQCPYCGVEVSADQNVCPNCNAKLK
jgi:hypothetical protein